MRLVHSDEMTPKKGFEMVHECTINIIIIDMTSNSLLRTIFF